MRANFGVVPRAVSKILSFKFISRYVRTHTHKVNAYVIHNIYCSNVQVKFGAQKNPADLVNPY